MADWLRHVLGLPCRRPATDHEFCVIAWDAGCGFIPRAEAAPGPVMSAACPVVPGWVDCEEVIRSLNARMQAEDAMSPFTLGPEPLRCPVCGTTRTVCLQRYGRDRQHEEAIRAYLDREPRP